jgi:hypothetical protein
LTHKFIRSIHPWLELTQGTYIPLIKKDGSGCEKTVIPGPKNPKAFDRYGYASNNLLRYNDPSGHCLTDPITITFWVLLIDFISEVVLPTLIAAAPAVEEKAFVEAPEIGAVVSEVAPQVEEAAYIIDDIAST